MGETEHFDYRGAIRDIEKTIAALQLPKTVLLVEDDLQDVDLSVRTLNQFNVKVSIATSAKEATELVSKQKFDIIMFDLVLPGADGLNFIMQSAGLQPGAHFILVTGYPTNPKVEEVLRRGALMLPKPLTTQTLELFLPPKVVKAV